MKFKKLFILPVIGFIGLINVNAATISFDKSSLTIKQGETEEGVLVNIKTDDNEKIEKVEFSLSYNNELITIKANTNEIYAQQGTSNGTSVIVLDPTENKEKPLTTGPIYSFSIKNDSSEDATEEITITNLKINGEDIAKEITDDIKPLKLNLKKLITTTTRVKNTDAKLSGFTVNNATIKPAFDEKLREYKIYTNKDSIRQVTILPKFDNASAGASLESVECTLGCSPLTPQNKLSLEMGKNIAIFTFKSEDEKTTETYTFTIYRGPTTDGSNLLSGLTIDGFNLNEKFDKSNLDYSATVPYTTENVKVNATAEDENADISIKGADYLAVGENVITVTVTSAETTEKKIYNITITREEFTPEEENNTVVTPIIEKDDTSTKKNNNTLLIVIAIISTLIIGASAYFLFFFKKKPKQTTSAAGMVTEERKISSLNKDIIDENKEPTSVDDALRDLMQTKETKIDNN